MKPYGQTEQNWPADRALARITRRPSTDIRAQDKPLFRGPAFAAIAVPAPI